MEPTAHLHHRLVWIHPFANGNGGWARIMADAYLARIDPAIFLDWSGGGTLTADSAHRAAYIVALRAADRYDFDPPGEARQVDLPPGRPSFITRVLGFDSGRFRGWQARRARSRQIAQAPNVLLRGFGCPARNAA